MCIRDSCGAGRYIRSNGINIQVLQFLCQITVDCLRPCFNRFFTVTPCVVGLRKVLHEIFYPVGVLLSLIHISNMSFPLFSEEPFAFSSFVLELTIGLDVSGFSSGLAPHPDVYKRQHIYRVESGGQRNQNRKNFKKFFSGMKKIGRAHV